MNREYAYLDGIPSGLVIPQAKAMNGLFSNVLIRAANEGMLRTLIAM